MKLKPFITYGMALLLLLGIGLLFRDALQGVVAPYTTSESFSEALWSTYGVCIIIVAFVIFAGGAGILVLLGGGWRWE
jgi:hypothetical protein